MVTTESIDLQTAAVKVARARVPRINLVLITPELAQQWLDETFPGQREIREWHVKELVGLMHDGVFLSRPITRHFVGDKAYVTDGRHRLSAQVKAGKSYWTTVEDYLDCTLEEVRAAYMAIDRGVRRTDADMVRASDVAHRIDMQSSEVNRLSSAALLIHKKFYPHGSMDQQIETRSPLLRAHLIEMWAPEAKKYFAIANQAKPGLRKLLLQRAVMSVALVTLRYQPDQAEEYFTLTALNDGLRMHQPEHTFIRLLTGQLTAGVLINSSAGNCILARQVAALWNAKYEGRDVEYVRNYNPRLPIRIAGTPFTSRGGSA